MDEPGKQCIVIFALLVKEVGDNGGGGGIATPPLPPPPLAGFRNNLCKDDSELFSRFLHGTHT